MEMDKGQILRSYAMAKNKNRQVGILAELNGCTAEEIRECLREQGVVVKTPGKKKDGTSKIADSIHVACNTEPKEMTIEEQDEQILKELKAAAGIKEKKMSKEKTPAAVLSAVKAEMNRLDVEISEVSEKYAKLCESKKELESWMEGRE